MDIEGKKIAIFHANNAFFALDNTCPGDEADLGKGFLDGRKENVSCPWYGHSFSLKTGISLFGDGSVNVYSVSAKNGSLVVSLEEK